MGDKKIINNNFYVSLHFVLPKKDKKNVLPPYFKTIVTIVGIITTVAGTILWEYILK